MSHSKITVNEWELKEIVFDDGPAGIVVGMLERETLLSMALKWSKNVKRKNHEGKESEVKSIHGKETDWMIIPFDFAKAIGKELIEKKILGKAGFNEKGFHLMINWLLENGGVFDGMSY